jgi:hypothetical protein
MKVTCPFCSIVGEIPDQANAKPLRCRQCGTRFQPKPPAVDDFGATASNDIDNSTEQIIDVDSMIKKILPKPGEEMSSIERGERRYHLSYLRRLKVKIDHESSLHDKIQSLPHNMLGIIATILGTLGSISFLAYFYLPDVEDQIKENLLSIAAILNFAGFCLAAFSFTESDCLQTFSWAGLIVSGWPLAILAIIILAMLGVRSSGGSSSPKWAVVNCPYCLHSWYPRGHQNPAQCPNCNKRLKGRSI